MKFCTIQIPSKHFWRATTMVKNKEYLTPAPKLLRFLRFSGELTIGFHSDISNYLNQPHKYTIMMNTFCLVRLSMFTIQLVPLKLPWRLTVCVREWTSGIPRMMSLKEKRRSLVSGASNLSGKFEILIFDCHFYQPLRALIFQISDGTEPHNF